jgi:hypothetical protein
MTCIRSIFNMLAMGSLSGYSGKFKPFSPHAKWYTLIRPTLVHFDRPLTDSAIRRLGGFAAVLNLTIWLMN